MGNPYLGDDAVGVRLVACLRRCLGDVDGVTYVEECSLGGLNVLDLVAGHERLVVVDSIKAGGAPGSWYRFDGAALRETINLRNVHDTNLATALELGRRLGLVVPDDREVHVFAVEVDDDLTFSEHMTGALEDSFVEYASEICGAVASLLERPIGAPACEGAAAAGASV
jgi:hydrogenase maturation protease